MGVGKLFGKVRSWVTGARLRLSAVTVAAALAAAVAGVTGAFPAPVSLAAAQAGRVVAWGYNGGGQVDVPATAQSGVTAIAAGNTSTASFPVTVQYSWSGVLQPVNADGSSVFKAGSTVPVKFALTGPSAPVTTATAKLTYAYVSNGIVGTVLEASTNVTATTGNLFRYDPQAGQYVFNWSTKGLAPGTYTIGIGLGDGSGRTVIISLK